MQAQTPQTQASTQEVFYDFKRFLIKKMIEYEELIFSNHDIDDFIDIVVEKYKLSTNEMQNKIYDYLKELSNLLEKELGLKIVSVDGGDGDLYFIVPREIASNERLLDAVLSLNEYSSYESESNLKLIELVSLYLSSCGMGIVNAKTRRGEALAVKEIAEAWKVEFDKDYSGYNNHTYTGVIKLCVDDQCILEHVDYCNYVCSAHGVFKCFTYTFLQENEDDGEGIVREDVVKAWRSGNSTVVAVPVRKDTYLKRRIYSDGRICFEPLDVR